MSNKNYLLGVRIDDVYEKGIKSYLNEFISSKKFNMITPINPEMLIIAHKNPKFKKILNNSELNLCEATGIVLGFRLKSIKIKKSPGSSTIYPILDFCEQNNKKIFFLGTKPHINRTARENINQKFPNLKIDGYSPFLPDNKFSKEEKKKIFFHLKKFKPDIVCAFWGAPTQETWFSDNRNELEKLGIKIGISLGGTADFLSGYTKRAPTIWQKLNLEWFYRLTTEKGRAKRFFTRIPLFIFLVIKEIFSN